MEPATSSRSVLRAARSALVAGLAAGAILAATLAPAAAAPVAADPTATATATQSPRAGARALRDDQRQLERLFQQAQTQLEREQKALDRADDVVTRTQPRIDTMKGKGLDTASLEALAGFKTALASARASHSSAKAALDARVGFDADGKVADAARARATLEAARTAMAQARQTMTRAAREFRAGLGNVRLAQRLVREQTKLARLEKALAQAGEAATKARDFINAQKTAGKDTSKLEAALSAFKTAVASAQAGHDAAKSTLATKAGFDAAGKVTDPAQARATLESAGKAMREAAKTLRKAGADLRKATREFHAADKR